MSLGWPVIWASPWHATFLWPYAGRPLQMVISVLSVLDLWGAVSPLDFDLLQLLLFDLDEVPMAVVITFPLVRDLPLRPFLGFLFDTNSVFRLVESNKQYNKPSDTNTPLQGYPDPLWQRLTLTLSLTLSPASHLSSLERLFSLFCPLSSPSSPSSTSRLTAFSLWEEQDFSSFVFSLSFDLSLEFFFVLQFRKSHMLIPLPEINSAQVLPKYSICL